METLLGSCFSWLDEGLSEAEKEVKQAHADCSACTAALADEFRTFFTQNAHDRAALTHLLGSTLKKQEKVVRGALENPKLHQELGKLRAVETRQKYLLLVVDVLDKTEQLRQLISTTSAFNQDEASSTSAVVAEEDREWDEESGARVGASALGPIHTRKLDRVLALLEEVPKTCRVLPRNARRMCVQRFGFLIAPLKLGSFCSQMSSTKKFQKNYSKIFKKPNK